MALLGLNTPVTYGTNVTTIRKLAERGSIRFSAIDNCGDKLITEYWAKTDTDSGWRLSKLAYAAAVREFPALVGEYPETVTTQSPYAYQEYAEAIRRRLAETELSAVHWLIDAVGNEDWRAAYHYLLSASPADLLALAERIEAQGEAWDETQEPYHGL